MRESELLRWRSLSQRYPYLTKEELAEYDKLKRENFDSSHDAVNGARDLSREYTTDEMRALFD